jgi:hypothetical protein
MRGVFIRGTVSGKKYRSPLAQDVRSACGAREMTKDNPKSNGKPVSAAWTWTSGRGGVVIAGRVFTWEWNSARRLTGV